MHNLLISQKVIKDPHGQYLDAIEKSYFNYFSSLNIMLYPVSNFTENLDDYLHRTDYEGLVLSGGGDVSPSCYESKENKVFDCSPEREETETALIRKMVKKGSPILGICRGMYQLNYFFGGKITVDIHKNEGRKRKPKIDHYIKIESSIFDLKGPYAVNHYHDDGIKRNCVADCFDIFAVDLEFGNVEGIVHKDLPIIGIQWHPERKSPDPKVNKELICKLFKIKN